MSTSPPIATSGASPRKTQRQPTVWVSTPATGGPIKDGSTQADEIAAKIFGRRSAGYLSPMIT